MSETENIETIRAILSTAGQDASKADDVVPEQEAYPSPQAFSLDAFNVELRLLFPHADIDIQDDGEMYMIRHRFATASGHSDLVFPANMVNGMVRSLAAERLVKKAYKIDELPVQPGSIAFIDTETIGLAGGSGTLAFLVGVGYWKADEEVYILEQALLRDFPGEPLMTDWLERVLKNFTHLCTYNGKTFDIPLLKSRFLMNGVRSKAWEKPHLDLLHFSRRLWKKSIGRESLGNVEEQVLNLKRTKDLPSGDIPEVWKSFARSESFASMPRVLVHHAQDILSLPAVYERHIQAMQSPENMTEISVLESLVKFATSMKPASEWKDYREKIQERVSELRVRHDPARGWYEQALTARKKGNQELALSLCHQCLDENSGVWSLKGAVLSADICRESGNTIEARRRLEETLRQKEIDDDLRSLMGEDLEDCEEKILVYREIRDRLLQLTENTDTDQPVSDELF